MKVLFVVAALALVATFAVGSVKSGTKTIEAHQAKIEKILDEAK